MADGGGWCCSPVPPRIRTPPRGAFEGKSNHKDITCLRPPTCRHTSVLSPCLSASALVSPVLSSTSCILFLSVSCASSTHLNFCAWPGLPPGIIFPSSPQQQLPVSHFSPKPSCCHSSSSHCLDCPSPAAAYPACPPPPLVAALTQSQVKYPLALYPTKPTS